MSWDEILMSSSDLPRMYCLQRLVEIVYYNMKRIRLEWSQIWQILGPHVTRVACHQNSNVAYFALDKLRQLSLKFLDIDELANFKFQREFLRPFEVALENSNSKIKDMVLTCLHQMIQSKSSKLRSGWRTIFATFKKASLENNGELND
jgi:brefeldin A-inhibited guanine nucleotide-exchange protein